jgi:hypothetical protein
VKVNRLAVPMIKEAIANSLPDGLPLILSLLLLAIDIRLPVEAAT